MSRLAAMPANTCKKNGIKAWRDMEFGVHQSNRSDPNNVYDVDFLSLKYLRWVGILGEGDLVILCTGRRFQR